MSLLVGLITLSCGEKKENKEADGFKIERKSSQDATKAETPATEGVKASERVDLTNKGVGPITSVTLDPEIDQEMAAEGEAVYNQMCLACHKVGKGAKNGTGPMLNGIIGHPAGAVEGFKYSSGLQDAAAGGLVWDQAAMTEFLTKPRDFIKGTKMSFVGLKDQEDIDAVIAYLSTFE